MPQPTRPLYVSSQDRPVFKNHLEPNVTKSKGVEQPSPPPNHLFLVFVYIDVPAVRQWLGLGRAKEAGIRLMEERVLKGDLAYESSMPRLAGNEERLRHYVCPQCGTPVGNREVAMKRLNDWLQGRPPQPDAKSGFKFRNGKAPMASGAMHSQPFRLPFLVVAAIFDSDE